MRVIERSCFAAAVQGKANVSKGGLYDADFKQPLIMSTRQRLIAASGLLLISLCMAVLWWEGLALHYIQDDFLYSANIVASDTVYDKTTQRYSPTRNSVAGFTTT